MANMTAFYFDGVRELIDKIEALGEDIDDISFKAVAEAADIMEEGLKSEIISSTTKYGTGVLANSLHHNKPKKNAWGYFTVVTARGKDTKSGRYKKVAHASYNKKTGAYVGHRGSYGSGAVRNVDKLFYLEYGNSRQAPNPVIQRSVNHVEPKVLDKMQEVYDRMTEDK